MKVVTVIGARPQFIKAAVVSKELQKMGIEEILLHTGQHYDKNMSEIFFDEMGIPEPKYNLSVGSGSHGVQTAEILKGVEDVLLKEKPDYLMVYGDTNSTLAGALAAVKLHIKIAHVESGLRSFNRNMPEEINRVLTDAISDILFVPSQTAIDNLINEGIPENKIANVGDVMYNSSIYFSEVAEKKSTILQDLKLDPMSFVLLTLHRAENTDSYERLKFIIDEINSLKDQNFIFPIHPRTRKKLTEFSLSFDSHVNVIEPLGYIDMLHLQKNSMLVLTDSGGVQKEAYFLGRPCITYRDETEWTELVEHGFNVLLKPGMSLKENLEAMIKVDIDSSDIYGSGKASYQIAETLLNS